MQSFYFDRESRVLTGTTRANAAAEFPDGFATYYVFRFDSVRWLWI